MDHVVRIHRPAIGMSLSAEGAEFEVHRGFSARCETCAWTAQALAEDDIEAMKASHLEESRVAPAPDVAEPTPKEMLAAANFGNKLAAFLHRAIEGGHEGAEQSLAALGILLSEMNGKPGPDTPGDLVHVGLLVHSYEMGRADAKAEAALKEATSKCSLCGGPTSPATSIPDGAGGRKHSLPSACMAERSRRKLGIHR